MKSLQQIHDEQDKLPKVHAEVEAELKKLPGVIAVDIGFKRTGDKRTETLAFIVYVKEKKKESEIPDEEIIPKEMHGVPTDVVKIQEAGVDNGDLPDRTKYRPLKGGIQISNGIRIANNRYSVGTLGCLGHRISDGELVALSNYHVMYANGGHGIVAEESGTKIGQPEFWVSCLCCDCDTIGTILKGIYDGTVDAAICSIDSGAEVSNEIEGIGKVMGAAPSFDVGGITTSVRVGDPVKKRGRTTGLTNGTVESINFPLNVGGTLFSGQLHIDPVDSGDKFNDSGDSGSVILNASNQVVGLHFASPYKPETTDKDGTSVANKIHEVTSRLEITIPSGAIAGGSDDAILAGGTDASTIHSPATSTPLGTVETMNFVETRLNASKPGRLIIGLYYSHRHEVRDLINSCRPVKVAWNRNQGQAFLASIAKSITTPSEDFKTSIKGISLVTLLEKMHTEIAMHGSIGLKKDIEKYGRPLMNLLSNQYNAHKIIEQISLLK